MITKRCLMDGCEKRTLRSYCHDHELELAAERRARQKLVESEKKNWTKCSVDGCNHWAFKSHVCGECRRKASVMTAKEKRNAEILAEAEEAKARLQEHLREQREKELREEAMVNILRKRKKFMEQLRELGRSIPPPRFARSTEMYEVVR